MQELIEDLRAALDQMNRSLEAIKENTQKTAEQLDELKSRLD